MNWVIAISLCFAWWSLHGLLRLLGVAVVFAKLSEIENRISEGQASRADMAVSLGFWVVVGKIILPLLSFSLTGAVAWCFWPETLPLVFKVVAAVSGGFILLRGVLESLEVIEAGKRQQ